MGGNSKVLTFVTISPANYNLGETICSLNFASRCRSTELGQAKRQTATANSGGGSGERSGGSEEKAEKTSSEKTEKSTGELSAAKQLLEKRRSTTNLHSSASTSNLGASLKK